MVKVTLDKPLAAGKCLEMLEKVECRQCNRGMETSVVEPGGCKQ